MSVSCFLRDRARERLPVWVRSGPGPQELRACRAQWGQPAQGSPQTAGSLRWCIGPGILIGPSASARGPGVSECVHPCVFLHVSLSFCDVEYTALDSYSLPVCIWLRVLHICILGLVLECVKMFVSRCVCVCVSCSPCLFECTPHRALWAGMYSLWPFICSKIHMERTPTHPQRIRAVLFNYVYMHGSSIVNVCAHASYGLSAYLCSCCAVTVVIVCKSCGSIFLIKTSCQQSLIELNRITWRVYTCLHNFMAAGMAWSIQVCGCGVGERVCVVLLSWLISVKLRIINRNDMGHLHYPGLCNKWS